MWRMKSEKVAPNYTRGNVVDETTLFKPCFLLNSLYSMSCRYKTNFRMRRLKKR